MRVRRFLVVIVATLCAGELEAQRAVEVADLLRIKAVSDPHLSPDGAWVAYTVETADTAKDKRQSDLWMASWGGAGQVRLTWSDESEHTPRWSPDGRRLAFLSARGDPRDVDQLWLLDRAGGEARRVSDLAGGVLEFAWAPDGRRIALTASDPDPNVIPEGEDSSEHRVQPIVVDRFLFKEDETGYLGAGRDRLYLLDLDKRKAEVLTPGGYDEAAPACHPMAGPSPS